MAWLATGGQSVLFLGHLYDVERCLDVQQTIFGSKQPCPGANSGPAFALFWSLHKASLQMARSRNLFVGKEIRKQAEWSSLMRTMKIFAFEVLLKVLSFQSLTDPANHSSGEVVIGKQTFDQALEGGKFRNHQPHETPAHYDDSCAAQRLRCLGISTLRPACERMAAWSIAYAPRFCRQVALLGEKVKGF